MSQPAEVQGAGGFRYGAVLLFTLVFAVFALIVPDGSATRTIELFAAGATLFVAVLTSRAPAATRRLASAGVAIVVVGAGVTAALVGPHPALTFAATAALLALTAAIILAGLVRLVVERGVVLQAVFGALAVYMLVGLTFSFLIGALATGESSALLRPGDRRHPERAGLLQLHRAHDDRVRRLHGRHARGAGARGARDARRPALPRDGHRDARGEPPPSTQVTWASSR